MFKLELYDRKGQKLQIGDIVKISNGREIVFYAEVRYLEKEEVITPFHTFTFHSFEKVDQVPAHAKQLDEKMYNIWFTHSKEIDDTTAVKAANSYLLDWRACERLLENKVFRITTEKYCSCTPEETTGNMIECVCNNCYLPIKK